MAPTSPNAFTFRGHAHAYLDERHNRTRLNEWSVAVPVVLDFLSGFRAGRVVEVGDSLRHCCHPARRAWPVDPARFFALDVRAPWCDPVTWESEWPIDAAFSFAGLHHVGVDCGPRDPDRAVAAAANVRAQMAPGGEFLVVAPAGYNAALDREMLRGWPDRLWDGWMRREHHGALEWTECGPADAAGVKFVHGRGGAVAVWFAALGPAAMEGIASADFGDEPP